MLSKEWVGTISGYDPHDHQAIVHLQRGTLHPGDHLSIEGLGTHIDELVEHLEVDDRPVDEATAGQQAEFDLHRFVRAPAKVFLIRDPYTPQQGAVLQALFGTG